ncbi:MAG TPA: lysylphosphatidylglycerol synthase transmembrane domain-containing protein [Candidatus Saccharimonadales bacterium]|nr:lysylphosphatidylglycerol synthase transmembrane domain-containing protein [Candidatus Saccharimonadales bacterium]
MKKHLKTVLVFFILTATVGAFWHYLAGHPETVDQLRKLPPSIVLVLLVLYGGWFLAYVLVTRGTLRLFKKTMSRQENLLFNAYSSLINFFGPGQSGPAFRGAYLKKRHNLSIKKYLFGTLLYYGFYAALSAFFMLAGSRPWWQTALAVAAVAIASAVAIRKYKKRAHIGNEASLTLVNVGWIFAATVLQLTLQAAIYAIELHSVNAQASLGQILSYTGVANFALFVALTPGAIGIREAFLVFSQNLHHISNSSIVVANLIDRAVYLLFLGILFMLVITLHAKDKLHVNQLNSQKGSTKQKHTEL